MLSPRTTRLTRAALPLVLACATSLLAHVASAQLAYAVPDASSVGMTRFELQRSLLEIDDQRRKLESSLEPVDSVLRVLSADTAHLASMKRAPVVDRDAALVRSLVRQLRLAPGSPELTARLVSAINTTTRDFSAADNALATRVLIGPSAHDYLARAPNAGIVALDEPPPPYDTPLWDKLRQSDYGRQHFAPITDDELTGFQYAVSDTGFQSYKSVLMGAFTKRIAEIGQTRDGTRADIQRLSRKAAELAHVIGAEDESAGLVDARLITVALPLFAIVLFVLLLAPRAYRSPELQAYIFSSGLLLEFTTLVLVTGTVLVLGLGGKIHAEAIGTILGALSGFVLGRAAPRRAGELEIPARVAVAAPVEGAPYATPPQPPLRPGRFR